MLIYSTSGGPGGRGNQHARASAALREAPSRAKRGAAAERRLGGNSPVYCRGMEERLGAGNHKGGYPKRFWSCRNERQSARFEESII